jgi:hypothetical protein
LVQITGIGPGENREVRAQVQGLCRPDGLLAEFRPYGIERTIDVTSLDIWKAKRAFPKASGLLESPKESRTL